MNNNEDGAMKVPQAGCDKLTSPEEIAALSKYLRKKRIEHEESINLRDNADRKATSDLRNNISLSGNVERLNSSNLNALGKETAHKIIGESKGVDSLGNQRVEAEGVQKNQDKLSSNLEKLGSSKEDVQLFKDLLRVGLQNKDNTLREDREKIEGDKQEISLSDELLSIADKNEPKLTSKVERLSDTDKKISLSNELSELEIEEDIDLSKELLGLISDKEDKSLSTTIEKLKKNDEDVNLSDELLRLSDNKELTLERTSEKLVGERQDNTLREDREKIEGDKQEISLSDELLSIADKNEPKLTSKVERLSDTDKKISLSNELSELEIEEDIDLSKEREKLERSDENSISLSDELLKLSDNKEITLGETLETLTDDKDIMLSGNVEKLTDNTDDISLSDKLLEIADKKDEDSFLGKQVEQVVGDHQEFKLGNTLEGIIHKTQGAEILDPVPELSDKTENIDDNREINLADELLSLQTRKSVDNLGGETEKIIGDAKNDYYELPINPLNVVPGDSPEIKKINVEAADTVPGNIINGELETEVSKVGGDNKEVNLEVESTKIIGNTLKITELDETPLKDITVNEEITLDNNSENIPGEIITVKISDERSHIIGEEPELMRLGSDVEKIGGKTNEINSLSDKLPETLDTNEIEKLEGQVEKPTGVLPIDKKLVNGVEKIVEDVTPKSDEPILNAKAENVIGNTNNELKLETGVDKIEDGRKFVLENNSETVIGETEKDIRLDSIAEGVEGSSKIIENLPLNSSMHPTGDTTSKINEISYVNPEIIQNQKNIVLDLEKDAEKTIGESPVLEELPTQNDNSIIGYDKDAKPVLSENKETIYSEHGIDDPVLERDRENIILSGDTQLDPKLVETTEKIKNIANTEPELRKDANTPEGQILESINLSEEKETVSGDFAEFDSLPNKALKKEGEDKVVELSETVIKEVQKFEKENLETNVLDVSGDIPETKELSGHREDLEGTKDPDKLSDTRLDLGDQENPELSDKVIREVAPKEVIDLSHERLDLKDIENPELSDTLIKEVSVEDTPLSNKRLDLDGVEDHELSDILVKEVVEKEVDLSNIREDIEIEEVDSLSDVLIKEVTTEEVSLSDTLIKEVTETNPELSDVVIKEVSPVDPSLSDIVIKEASQIEPDLSDVVIKEATAVEPDLSELLLILETEDPESLSDILIKASKNDTDKINVGANYKRDDEGSETSDDFSHSGWQESLSVGREKVEGEVEDKDLSDILLTLDYEDETPLSTTQIKTPGNDISKINVGRNLIPDDPETDEDGNITGPGGDDYSHTGWNEVLDDRKLDVHETDEKSFDDNSEQEWVSGLSDIQIKRNTDDTSKINVGANYKREDETDETSDDYTHSGWNEKLSTGQASVSKKGGKGFTEDKESGSVVQDWINGLGDTVIKRSNNDTSKINVGRNLIPDDPETDNEGNITGPGGDDYSHKDWNETLDDRKLDVSEKSGKTFSDEGEQEWVSELSNIKITRGANDISKINVGKNLIPDVAEDGEKSPAGDDYAHQDWNESLDNRKLDVSEQGGKGFTDDSLQDWIESLYEEDDRIQRISNDTSKINVGKNLIRDLVEDESGELVSDPAGDDYAHTGWDEKNLDKGRLKVIETDNKTFNDESEQEWVQGLEEEIVKVSINDTSKVNVGKNLIPDSPELDEDGNYIGPGGDDYQHRDWNEQLDERVLDIKESEVKKITDGKEEEWDEETLYEEAVKRAEKDKSKINVGNNMIAERWHVKLSGGKTLEFPAGDDYRYKGWDEKNLDKRLLGIEDDDSEKLDLEGNPHSRFNAEEDGLYEEALKTQDNDTSKVNVGKNLIPDSPELDEDGNESPGGDDYVHTGWNESLDNRKLNAKKSDKDLEFSTGENDTVEADEDNLISQLIEILKSRKDTQLYYTNILKFAQNKNISSGWTAKLSSLMSAYLSGESSEERLKQFEIQLFKTIFTEYKDNLSAPETSDKINVGRNLIPDDPETDDEGNMGPGGDDYVHTGWNESLDKRKLNIRENKNDDVEKLGKETKNINKEGKKETKLKNDSVYVSKYKLNWHWQNVLDVSQYLRYVAEQATFGTHGSARTLLLDTTLMALVASRNVAERLAGANRDRLPGGNNVLGNIVGATQGNLIENAKAEARRIAKAGVKAMTGGDPNVSIDKTYPLNRPEDRWYRTEAFQPGNNRRGSVSEDNGGFLKSVGNAIAGEVKGFLGISAERSYSFKQNYLNNKAIGITLQELAGVNPSEISSVEDLRLAINNSDFLTSANKVTTSASNFQLGKVTTLDDNSNWEIVLAPFVHKEINGGISYLPPIDEINLINNKLFGIKTGYRQWIPFTSFELSKSRLVSKTIQLFDGEISYPTGIEYTNELRVSIADDQYKSWRRYFEKCANVAVYNSSPHEMGDYGITVSKVGLLNYEYSNWKEATEITKVDKTFICPAPYKNITFRCLIYCMTPQKETINKYDLLLVMKDFSEERSGDIEPGGGDLNVTFSIVGEHPAAQGLNGNMFDMISAGSLESKFKKWKTAETAQAAAEKVKDKANLAMSIVQATTLAAANGAIDMI